MVEEEVGEVMGMRWRVGEIVIVSRRNDWGRGGGGERVRESCRVDGAERVETRGCCLST